MTSRASSERLYLRYAYHGLVRRKGVTAVLLAVLVLSAFLTATGAMVIERVAGAVGGLAEQARPPHLLQMHKGGYDRAALEAFAARHDAIEAWLVTEMVGYESNALSWDRPATGESGSLRSSRFDHLFVTQNDAFDHLVDEDGNVPEPARGEVYVPVKYVQAFGLRAGDTLTVSTDRGPVVLDVRGVVKDAQMAASASSATRVLVSDEDFAQLRQDGGVPEVIVEYRLTDAGLADDLQRAYDADEALPRNGPAITGQQIQIISTFSDGLSAMALVLVGLLLVAVALLTLRFVITGTLEEEVQQIGALKAIGIPHRVVARLYLSTYVVLALVGCVTGGALAVVATDVLTRHLEASYAAAEVGPWTVLVPLIALTAVFVVVVAICRTVLRRVRRIEVVNALVHGSARSEEQSARRARRRARRVRRTGLASASGRDLTLRLALVDLRAEARQWALLPVVFLVTAVLVTVPANLLSTFESPQLVTYLGAPERDLRVDLQLRDGVDDVRAEVAAALAGDERLTGLQAYASVQYRTEGPEGVVSLPVEVGDYADGTIRFTHGAAPDAGQIALSALNASALGVGVGDALTVERGGASSEVEVSGIYQDLTAGGKTAKMHGAITQGASAYVFYADVADGEDPVAVADALQERFPTAVVFPMAEYLTQTFAGTTTAFRSAALLALVLGVGVATLVTSMFLSLRLAQDRSTMGVLSAIGFSASELVGQVRTKTAVTVVAGTLLGTVVAHTGGASVASGLLAALQMPVSDLTLVPEPWLVHGLYPLLLVGAALLSVVLLTAGIRDADKSQWLRD